MPLLILVVFNMLERDVQPPVFHLVYLPILVKMDPLLLEQPALDICRVPIQAAFSAGIDHPLPGYIAVIALAAKRCHGVAHIPRPAPPNLLRNLTVTDHLASRDLADELIELLV